MHLNTTTNTMEGKLNLKKQECVSYFNEKGGDKHINSKCNRFDQT